MIKEYYSEHYSGINKTEILNNGIFIIIDEIDAPLNWVITKKLSILKSNNSIDTNHPKYNEITKINDIIT